ncbi:MAG: hypothetical protein KAR40_11195 [Candidatus Sabulitectum sp.]|nr:hypothetical protein [Candidatus Sabulitectum sp.]
MTKNPLLLWLNKVPDTYSIIVGTENSGLQFTEAFTWDALRNWIVTSNGSGVVTVQANYETGSAWLISTSYALDTIIANGGVSYRCTVAHTSIAASEPGVGASWEVYWVLDTPDIEYLILGAHRHDASGYRFAGGSIQLQYWNGSAFVDCLATTAITAKVKHPSIHEVAAHTVIGNAGYYSYQLTISGMGITEDIALPELFMGPALVMPGVRYNFDPNVEEWTGPSTTTETGRIYESALSRRYAPRPSFNFLNPAKDIEVNEFIENRLEERGAFWWFWNPLDKPAEGYMMKHRGKSAPKPIMLPDGSTKFDLNMIESV